MAWTRVWYWRCRVADELGNVEAELTELAAGLNVGVREREIKNGSKGKF